MAFIPAVDCARVTIHQRLHGQAISNTFYVQKTGGFGEDDLTSLAARVQSWLGDELRDNLSVNWSAERIVARAMHAEEAPGIEVDISPDITGGIGSQGAPGNVCLAIKLKTGLTGRNRAGRIFQGGIAEDDTEGNAIEPSRGDELVGDWENLRTALAAATAPMVIASFYDGFTLVDFPDGTRRKKPTARATAIITPVSSVSADGLFDSQKRRLAGHGS